jgi:hypothetical protein
MSNIDTVTVTLLRAGHEHEGKSCAAGDQIAVPAAVKDWLIAQGLVAPDPAPSKPTRNAQE